MVVDVHVLVDVDGPVSMDDQCFVPNLLNSLLFQRAIPMIYVFDIQAEAVREISA